eukprot:CAMPEP_0176401676 /NCGR_PEP_ID=MMETSP0126-20121128/48631_1 /TAXON_ID=141414 ORGANISM="Strombidinopsis acuminatum, Strain SPMC142" /NCGR_SAMPLE_ID=MMETSP0126 /ASSEMBLY_ACC=CAM_ASM_000229 /LENGTH=58 /DNA_ID=CAMNT_0017778761 /DNA_START=236 /DNA_END=412 /DNA_ORIENTATION=+
MPESYQINSNKNKLHSDSWIDEEDLLLEDVDIDELLDQTSDNDNPFPKENDDEDPLNR